VKREVERTVISVERWIPGGGILTSTEDEYDQREELVREIEEVLRGQGSVVAVRLVVVTEEEG
jgi:hypothetical protein